MFHVMSSSIYGEVDPLFHPNSKKKKKTKKKKKKTKKKKTRGTRVAQSAERPALAQVMISWIVNSSS